MQGLQKTHVSPVSIEEEIRMKRLSDDALTFHRP